MAGKLLVAFLGLLLIIPNHGNPVPEKDTLNDNKTENKEESPKTESVSTEKPTDVTSKSNEVTQSTTSKSKEQPKETQTTKMATTTTPEPDVEDDEDQVYFMLPKRQKSNQVAYFKPQQPFYFNPNGFQKQQQRFTFNQPKMQMPFSFPMMFQPMLDTPNSNTNNFMNFDSQPGMFDDSNMFSVPQSHRWSFDTNTEHRNIGHPTSFMPRAHSWYGGMVNPMYSKQITNHYL